MTEPATMTPRDDLVEALVTDCIDELRYMVLEDDRVDAVRIRLRKRFRAALDELDVVVIEREDAGLCHDALFHRAQDVSDSELRARYRTLTAKLFTALSGQTTLRSVDGSALAAGAGGEWDDD